MFSSFIPISIAVIVLKISFNTEQYNSFFLSVSFILSQRLNCSICLGVNIHTYLDIYIISDFSICYFLSLFISNYS